MKTKDFFSGFLRLVKGRWLRVLWAGRPEVCLLRIKLLGFLLLFFLIPFETSAQCAMCRAVLESGENTAMAEGVNNGIVYLMAVPYLLMAVLFYFVFKKMKS